MQNTNKKHAWLRKLIPAGIITIFFFLIFILQLPVSAATSQIVSSWSLTGSNQAAEKYQSVDPNILAGKDTLKLTYDLHGACLLDGDASAIIFDQPAGSVWRFVSLSRYGKNCYDGVQSIDIPLSQFTGLITSLPVGMFHVRIWNSKAFKVDINSVEVYAAQASSVKPTPPQIAITAAPTPVAPTSPAQTAAAFKGEYFNNVNLSGAPSVVRSDKLINFVWNQGSPDSSIGNNFFSARWSKTEKFTEGNYMFIVSADDGIRLYVDGKLLIDKWIDQPMKTYTATTALSSGDHSVKLEYYEKAGGAIAKMNYAPTAASPLPSVTSTPAPTTGIKPTSIPSAPTPTSTVALTPTKAVVTATPTSVPLPTPVSSTAGWQIKSVSSMKETKDKLCGQDDQNFINQWVAKAAELGVNYIAVETPYDNPSCADAVSYTKKWVDAIRARGLKVWHRHMPLAFEGIYSVQKNNGSTYLTMISDYVRNNPTLFAQGDIFTPIPEPQNGGISGITYCAQGVCQFPSKEAFNKWLRDAMDTSENAFQTIGLGGKMKIGYFGFDGFVAWGANNPDWSGILEDATVSKMGNITIDHYPELINTTMTSDLKDLHVRYPNVPIIVGEWGSTGTTDLAQQVTNSMGAAKNDPLIIGFNYWHMGMGGNESLINSDFTNKPQFATVQSYFK